MRMVAPVDTELRAGTRGQSPIPGRQDARTSAPPGEAAFGDGTTCYAKRMGPPKKRPSGMFNAVQGHARRAVEALGRCSALSPSNQPCALPYDHVLPHRDEQGFEWIATME